MCSRLVILFFILIGIQALSRAQGLSESVLQDIYTYQKTDNDVLDTASRFNSVRHMLNEMDSLLFITQEKDTVFLLEMYDMETSISYGKIWNKKKGINFTYDHIRNLIFSDEDLFPEYIQKLVSDWRIKEIRKEEKSSGIPTRNNIYATKVVLGKKNKIRVITFEEFYCPV